MSHLYWRGRSTGISIGKWYIYWLTQIRLLLGLWHTLLGKLPQLCTCSVANATFLSTNFENILTWKSEGQASLGTAYDVQYKRYGEEWHNKSECQNLTHHFCNLTQETENFEERYHARVRAVVPNCCTSEWACTQRFYPREDTDIGAPEVTYIPSVQSMKFIIQHPYTPLRDEEDQLLTIEDIYSKYGHTDYHITISIQKTQQKWVKNEKSNTFEVPNLEPDTEYNGVIYINYFEKRSKPYVFRVRTLPDNNWLLYLFGVLVFAVSLLFVTIYYVIHKYMKQHASRPMSLDIKGISSFKPLTLSVESILNPLNDLDKSSRIPVEVPLSQINIHLQQALEQSNLFSLSATAYQQQAKVMSFQPINQADGLPMSYAPQLAKNSLPCVIEERPLTLTYGVCVDGTSCIKTHSQLNLPT
uniref:Tissue factor n=1 Tax=Sphenodon punctatus TaxID=8508 RepID=A0A8D0HFD7_SPHPU